MTIQPIENIRCELCGSMCQDSEIEETWAMVPIWYIGQKRMGVKRVKACFFCRLDPDEPIPFRVVDPLTDNRDRPNRLSSSTNLNRNDQKKQPNSGGNDAG